MRILLAHNRHRTSGGADHVLEREADLLRAAGHDVDLFLVPAAEDAGLSSAQMGMAATWNRNAMRELRTMLGTFRPDVLHVHTPFPLMSPAVFRTATKVGVPTVTTAHSFRYSCIAATCLRDGRICEDCVGSALKLPGIRHRCYHDSVAGSAALTISLATHRALGTFARRVGRFITLTDFAKDLLVRDGVPEARVAVKPNFVPDRAAPLPIEQRRRYALFAGRLVEEKGIRTLLTAWRELGDRIPLLVAGDGPLRDLVRDAAADGVAVEHLGWRDPDEVAELQRHATLTVVPSEWYEAGPPLVLLDALAAGTPVVCSDLRNISESVVAHDAGRVFRTGDAASLARTVAEIAYDATTLSQLSKSGRVLYEDVHTPQATLSTLERIYHAVIQSR